MTCNTRSITSQTTDVYTELNISLLFIRCTQLIIWTSYRKRNNWCPLNLNAFDRRKRTSLVCKWWSSGCVPHHICTIFRTTFQKMHKHTHQHAHYQTGPSLENLQLNWYKHNKLVSIFISDTLIGLLTCWFNFMGILWETISIWFEIDGDGIAMKKSSMNKINNPL